MAKNGKVFAERMKTSQVSELPKIAIVYDRLNSAGGAEKILSALQSLYPQAIFYSSVFDKESTPWLLPQTQVRTSWLQHFPGAKNHHQWFGWLMPFLFELFDFSEFDIVISISSEAAKGVLTQPEQLHVNYVLTPTRYLWSHASEYEEQVPVWLRGVMKKVVQMLREWDKIAAWRPDVMVPISQLVKQRVEKYYHRNITQPIYPPVELTDSVQKPALIKKMPQEFFFTWGRHVQYKQFETVIRASVVAQIPVVIAGSGPDTSRLQHLAQQLDPQSKNIFFVGKVSDAELHWCLKNSLGTLFPQIEDFGIVILESLLAGCPAIVHEKSGATELMTQQDGLFLTEVSVQILAESMQKMRLTAWQRLDIQRRARQYAGVRFSDEWSRFVKDAWKKHQATLDQKTERNL